MWACSPMFSPLPLHFQSSIIKSSTFVLQSSTSKFQVHKWCWPRPNSCIPSSFHSQKESTRSSEKRNQLFMNERTFVVISIWININLCLLAMPAFVILSSCMPLEDLSSKITLICQLSFTWRIMELISGVWLFPSHMEDHKDEPFYSNDLWQDPRTQSTRCRSEFTSSKGLGTELYMHEDDDEIFLWFSNNI